MAVLKSSARSSTATTSGPGRSCQGFDGNHSVAVAAHTDCRVCRVGTGRAEDGPRAGGDRDDVEVVREVHRVRDGDAVQVRQLRALAAVRVDVGAHGEQAVRLGVAQCLQPHVLLRGKRR